VGSIHKFYRLTELDETKVTKIRFKAKAHLQKDGRHDSKFNVGQHYWFSLDRLNEMLEPEINRLQSDRIESDEKRMLSTELDEEMKMLGYD
jgi:hypothetical protein